MGLKTGQHCYRYFCNLYTLDFDFLSVGIDRGSCTESEQHLLVTEGVGALFISGTDAIKCQVVPLLGVWLFDEKGAVVRDVQQFIHHPLMNNDIKSNKNRKGRTITRGNTDKVKAVTTGSQWSQSCWKTSGYLIK